MDSAHSQFSHTMFVTQSVRLKIIILLLVFEKGHLKFPVSDSNYQVI